MSLTLDPDRTTFIHDFDGVHYPYAAFPGINQQLDKFAQDCALEIATQRDVLTNLDAVTEILDRTFKQRGNPSYAISDIIGDPCFRLRAQFNRARHERVFDWMKQEQPHICQADQERVGYFEKLSRLGVQHGLLTAGEYQLFARDFLEATAVLKHFNEACLLDFAAVAGYSKMEDFYPMQVALHCLDVIPKQVVFIEDSLKNFKPIKDMYPEILTVLVNNNQDHRADDTVDMQFQDLNAFLKFSTETLSAYRCQHAMNYN